MEGSLLLMLLPAVILLRVCHLGPALLGHQTLLVICLALSGGLPNFSGGKC